MKKSLVLLAGVAMLMVGCGNAPEQPKQTAEAPKPVIFNFLGSERNIDILEDVKTHCQFYGTVTIGSAGLNYPNERNYNSITPRLDGDEKQIGCGSTVK